MNIRNRKNKYNAQRHGRFDSGAEQEYNGVLQLLKRAGEIQDFRHHPPPARLKCRVTWRPDFMVWPKGGDPYYVEIKSPVTYQLQAFRFLMKCYRFEFDQYHELPPVYVVQRYKPNKFKLIESIKKT